MNFSKITLLVSEKSFYILLLGGLLVSCQKKSFQQEGALTKLSIKKGRFIASKNATLPHFTSFQDPKQIIVFCENTSKKVKVCYNHHLAKTLESFTTKHMELSLDQRDDLRTATAYGNIRPVFDNLINEIKLSNNEKLNAIVNSRKLFCEKHSKYDLKKCLTQFLEKDTFSVLNFFHGTKKLNGHEYIYLKGQFRTILEARLVEAKNKIQMNRKVTL